MIPQELVRKINRGRCLVLVGSGLSCDAGYPSWKTLAEKTTKYLIEKKYVEDNREYIYYLENEKYPELFSQAEKDVGDREKLCDIVCEILEPIAEVNGNMYDLICRWPFACYLTTNFDDELYLHLE